MFGEPIRVEWAPGLRDARGEVHAGSFIRERRIAFDCTRAEFPRIFAHELFHFVWVRLGNPARRQWESVLSAEWQGVQRGELGWSAEWRKRALKPDDIENRARAWRLYACESFCDTAAWIYSGVAEHAEFTLQKRARERRKRWFVATLEARRISI